MNRLLAFETSSEACSVALAIDGQVIERFRHAPRQHADLLLPWVRELQEEAGIGLSDLDAIAFGRGPGSFTSLRIGIGVVQGLAWGAELPVVPVSSLAALAQGAASPDFPRVLVAMDARMDEIYSCSYELGPDGIVRALAEERVCSPEVITPADPSAFIGAGNGYSVYPRLQELGHALQQVHGDAWPTAGAVCQLATRWLEQHEPLPAAGAQPVYIRNKVASKPGEK
jgi:tRNA threonylcarbamoyladenosine biosynthesis protein TsaB